MELRQLRYFAKVAELGSFTRAAAELDVVQPALSRQIRDLEQELGVSLLSRNGRGVVLTDAGVKLLHRARAILDDAERARQEAQASTNRPMGMVSIGMPPAIGAIIAIPVVERVQGSYPGIHLQLTEGYSGHIVEWLLSGRLDLGIVYNAQRNVGLGCERLLTEQLYLVGAPSLMMQHIGSEPQIKFARLTELPLILPARPHAIRRVIDDIAGRNGLQIELGLEVNAFLALRDLVTYGSGLTILPISPLLPEIRAGSLKTAQIIDPKPSHTVGLASSTHHAASLATTTVARIVRTYIRELIDSGAWPISRACEPSIAGRPKARRAKLTSLAHK